MWHTKRPLQVLLLVQFLDEVFCAHNIQVVVPDTDIEVNSPVSLVQYPVPDPDIIQDQTSLDTWSVVWYVASFGGLILFFLIVSCSEWCCRRTARRNCQRNGTQQTTHQPVSDTPPPSYDLFAPPAYEDLWKGSDRNGGRGEKTEYDVYVVPIHALDTIMEEARREEAPPSYQNANRTLAQVGDLPQVHYPNSTGWTT